MRAAGHATRKRILAAAKDEFAAFGYAGARLNRIAGTAAASKERLYSYFANKEALFEAVTRAWVTQVGVDTSWLTAEGIPDYVGRLFDSYVRYPDNVRLQMWIELEAPDHLFTDDAARQIVGGKLDEIGRAQRLGLVDSGWRPIDLLVLLTETARSLAMSTHAFTRIAVSDAGSDDIAADVIAARRRSAVSAAERLIAPNT